MRSSQRRIQQDPPNFLERRWKPSGACDGCHQMEYWNQAA